MSYFPRSLMPLTPKSNAPGSIGAVGRTKILSAEYNVHDVEILAVEQYLGAQPYASWPDQGARMLSLSPQAPNRDPSTLFGKIAILIDNLNGFADPAGGANVSSGYVASGKRPIMPAAAHATFLTANVGTQDTTIAVNSVIGFPPGGGVISIPNSVEVASLVNGAWAMAPQTSMMEFVKYGGTSGNVFTGCQRGYLGTTASPHSMAIVQGTPPCGNARDYVGNMALTPGVSYPPAATRRNPAWRAKSAYGFQIVGLQGDLTLLAWRVMRRAGQFRVPSNQGDTQKFVDAATGLGILGTRQDGTYYLVSKTPSLAAIGQLSWAEADGFVQATVANGAIVPIVTDPGAWPWKYDCIPVFQGKLSVQYGPICLGAAAAQCSVRVRQTSAGNVECLINEGQAIVGMVGYQAFFVASQLSQDDINDQCQLTGCST